MAHIGQELTFRAGSGFGSLLGLLQLLLRSPAFRDVTRDRVNHLLFSEWRRIPREPLIRAAFAEVTVLKGDDVSAAGG